MFRLCLAAVILAGIGFGQSVEAVNCAGSIQRPIYPRLARIAQRTGEVKVSLIVGQERKPLSLDVSGDFLFLNVVRSAIELTEFDASCANRKFSQVSVSVGR
jgi:hypothetical protein